MKNYSNLLAEIKTTANQVYTDISNTKENLEEIFNELVNAIKDILQEHELYIPVDDIHTVHIFKKEYKAYILIDKGYVYLTGLKEDITCKFINLPIETQLEILAAWRPVLKYLIKESSESK